MHKIQVDRRLAAIFAGDIAGYSRLIGADEEGTLRQLKAHRKDEASSWGRKGAARAGEFSPCKTRSRGVQSARGPG